MNIPHVLLNASDITKPKIWKRYWQLKIAYLLVKKLISITYTFQKKLHNHR